MLSVAGQLCHVVWCTPRAIRLFSGSIPLMIDEKVLGAQFQRIRLETKTHEAERIAVNHLARAEFQAKSPALTTGVLAAEISLLRLRTRFADTWIDHMLSLARVGDAGDLDREAARDARHRAGACPVRSCK